MVTETQAEGLLNALRDVHQCGLDCFAGCVLTGLDPVLPSDRDFIVDLTHYERLQHAA